MLGSNTVVAVGHLLGFSLVICCMWDWDPQPTSYSYKVYFIYRESVSSPSIATSAHMDVTLTRYTLGITASVVVTGDSLSFSLGSFCCHDRALQWYSQQVYFIHIHSYQVVFIHIECVSAPSIVAAVIRMQPWPDMCLTDSGGSRRLTRFLNCINVHYDQDTPSTSHSYQVFFIPI